MRPLLATGFAGNEIHVWIACLDVSTEPGKSCLEGLVRKELAKADQFRFDQDRRRYIGGRGFLRRLLEAYLHIPRGAIEFAYGPFGKPELAGSARGRLRFNLSHAGNHALCALAPGREVGVDLEPRRGDVPWRELASVVFSPLELRELDSMPAPDRPQAFLGGWTRLEAYLKARGDGLSGLENRSDIPLGRLAGPFRLGAVGNPQDRQGWWLYPIDALPDHAAALVAGGDVAQVRLGFWPIQAPDGAAVETGPSSQRKHLPSDTVSPSPFLL